MANLFFASSFSEDNILNQSTFKKYKKSYLPNRKDLLKQDLKKIMKEKKLLFCYQNFK